MQTINTTRQQERNSGIFCIVGDDWGIDGCTVNQRGMIIITKMKMKTNIVLLLAIILFVLSCSCQINKSYKTANNASQKSILYKNIEDFLDANKERKMDDLISLIEPKTFINFSLMIPLDSMPDLTRSKIEKYIKICWNLADDKGEQYKKKGGNIISKDTGFYYEEYIDINTGYALAKSLSGFYFFKRINNEWLLFHKSNLNVFRNCTAPLTEDEVFSKIIDYERNKMKELQKYR